MKKSILLIACILSISFCNAQKVPTEAEFITAFKQVVADSYNDFKKIRGDKIGTSKDSFTCKVQLPGSAGTYINTFALSSFYAKYNTETKEKGQALYQQILGWTKKSYLPNKVFIKKDSSMNTMSNKFFILTENGMHNWRTAINFVSNKKGEHTITVYVSGIKKREFTYANKTNVIKDDKLKNSIISLFKEAIKSDWQDITDTAIIETKDLPFVPPFSMEDGTYKKSTYQLPYGQSYLYTEESNTTFIHLLPLNGNSDNAKKEFEQWVNKLKYALPSHYVVEIEKKNDDAYLYQVIFPTDNYEPTLYDGIEVQIETVAANENSQAQQYLVTKFKLYKSSTIKL
jgi:hypothetical protein